jgi:hypothetical protein
MEWAAILELLKDENIAKFLSDYTIAIGVIGGVIGVAVKFIPGKADDAIWEEIKNKFRLVKK